MADHPLRPANDRRLGGLLPRQQANRTQAPLQATCAFGPRASCGISHSFPWLSPTRRQIPTRYSPVRHCRVTPAVRLACVKHAASVRSEPGSNSQVHHVSPLPAISHTGNPGSRETRRTNPASYSGSRFLTVERPETILTSVTVTHQSKIHHGHTHKHLSLNQHRAHSQLHPSSDKVPRLFPTHARTKRAAAENTGAPPTYPFHRICSCQRTVDPVRPKLWVRRGRRLVGAVPPRVNAITPPTIISP